MRALLSDQYSWVWLRRAAKRTFWISLGILVLLPIIAALVSDSIWTSVLGVFVSIAAWVAALAILSWIVSRIAFWWLKGPIRWGIFTPKIRRAYLLAVFDNTMRQTQIHRLRLVRVIHVYQVNRSGTKCVVEHPEGVRQDAWFWNFSPKRGHVFIVRSSTGYGPHNSNAQVMYIGSKVTGPGIVGGIPAASWKAAHKRLRGR
ncbi:hypothetical protein FHU41_000239 [Psychromicrobium silvestre]|uniref:Uncharacterized protein n=1 Tax=Psychromicrobium silvestre TaxID=1645614 RepID=A0A7Y9LR23_9MICC|nr:hypothetical protein [Psychromicrobium silvestre]